MAQAPRDDNREPGLAAKSDADNTPVILEADPVTKRLKVNATITGGGTSGTQYTDGDATITHPIGTIPVYDKAGTITAVSVANPLPVSATIDTSAVATSANQTNKTQFTKITDGTDTALVTASGEINVLATAQPGVDIGDVTVNNSTGAAAVNIQDGGNSITVDNGGTFASQATLQTQTDTVMVGGVNIKEINAVTPLMGNGVTGTGSQRVTIASDNTAFPVNATLSAETTKVIGTINVAASQTIAVTNTGTFATQPTIQTGTNSIGKISDITTSVVPGTAATSLGKAEDAAHTTGDTGVMALGVRNDTLADTTNTTADYSQVSTDIKGRIMTAGAPRLLKGTAQISLSATTSETTIISATASTFHDVYGVILANTGATTTKVSIRDDTAGTVRAIIEVPTLETRGFMLPVDSAVPQTAVNKNWTAQCGSSTTALEVTMFYVSMV